VRDESGDRLKGPAATLLSVARAIGRDDVASSVQDAYDRTQRDDVLIVVLGEHKRGKSSLVNGLLGDDICPSRPDRATAVPTVLRAADSPAVTLAVADSSGSRQIAGTKNDLPAMVLEDSDLPSGTNRLVAMVDLPNTFLKSGFRVVDSPGVGGLSPGFAEAALNLARLADIVIVVADAGAPLDPATRDLVRRAAQFVPMVVVTLTRADLYRHGGASAEIRAQLSADGFEGDVITISSALKAEATKTGDRALEEESGFPLLMEMIGKAARRRGDLALRNAESEFRRASQVLLAAVDRDLALNPESDESWNQALRAARVDLDVARQSAARWQTMLNEGVSDAAMAGEAELRKVLRRVTDDFEMRIDEGTPSFLERGLSGLVQARVQEEAAAVLSSLGDALAGIEARLLALFDEVANPQPDDGEFFNSSADWPTQSSSQRPPTGVKSAAMGVYTSLRGAQSGIILVGVFSGIAGLGLGTLAIAGIGLAFGGKQLFDERQRRLQSQRQQAKSALQRYLGDVQAEDGQAMRELGREELRRIRDLVAAKSSAFLTARAEREKQLTFEREQSREESAARAQTLERLRHELTSAFESTGAA
jgi:hypothetical protein